MQASGAAPAGGRAQRERRGNATRQNYASLHSGQLEHDGVAAAPSMPAPPVPHHVVHVASVYLPGSLKPASLVAVDRARGDCAGAGGAFSMDAGTQANPCLLG